MGLKTALVMPRTVLSRGEAGKGELTQMLCKQEERKPHRGGHDVAVPPQSFRHKPWARHRGSPHSGHWVDTPGAQAT